MLAIFLAVNIIAAVVQIIFKHAPKIARSTLTSTARAYHGHLQVRLWDVHLTCLFPCSMHDACLPHFALCPALHIRKQAKCGNRKMYAAHASVVEQQRPANAQRQRRKGCAPKMGMTSTAAKLVWRAALALKGDWRTSLCVPFSPARYPYAYWPCTSNSTLFMPASSPAQGKPVCKSAPVRLQYACFHA